MALITSDHLKAGVATCNPRTSPHCAGAGVASAGLDLVYASCHCHAPSCMSCEVSHGLASCHLYGESLLGAVG